MRILTARTRYPAYGEDRPFDRLRGSVSHSAVAHARNNTVPTAARLQRPVQKREQKDEDGGFFEEGGDAVGGNFAGGGTGRGSTPLLTV